MRQRPVSCARRGRFLRRLLAFGAISTVALLASGPAFGARPLGIDVSAWQGYRSQANWNSAYADGRVFALIRITHYFVPGVESDSHGDPDWYYTTNLPFARNAGFLAGGYHYARPTLRTPAVEAEYFLTYARPYITNGYLRPVLDFEGAVSPVIGATSLSDWGNQWLNYIHRQTGIKPMVYCNYNWAHNYLGDIDTSFPLWFARWSCPADPHTDVPRLDGGAVASTSPWSTWTFWQYCGGPVAGFSGNIDLDVFNGTYEQLRGHVIGTGITNVQATSVTANTATITWTTDAASSSQVQYGLTTAYGTSTPLDSTNVTSHSVTLTGLTPGTLYHYRVISANPSWPTATTSADFTFTTSSCALSITQQPGPQVACAGGTAVFNVAAGGGSLTYQWQKYSGSTWENLSSGGRISGATTATLTIAGVVTGDVASYRCVVTSTCSVTSNSAALTLAAATTITQQPQPRSACPGGTVTFTVAGTGNGGLTYRWQKDGTNLNDGGTVSGATTATLMISGVSEFDVGDYRCVVTGGCGSATSNAAAFSLKAATTFAQPPQAQVAALGASATFTALATGDGTVAYQWQKGTTNLSNGGRISGATSATLTISGVVRDDAGDYRCIATAGCGVASSTAAALTVSLPVWMATDFDADGDVDLSDFGFFQMCFNGPNQTTFAECGPADFDLDNDVDLADFSVFQRCFNGPNRPAACQ